MHSWRCLAILDKSVNTISLIHLQVKTNFLHKLPNKTRTFCYMTEQCITFKISFNHMSIWTKYGRLYWWLTFLLEELCLCESSLIVVCWLLSFGTDVSTTTSGWTTISVEEYCDGSSDIVVKERSEGIRRGYFIFRLDRVARTGRLRFFNLGDGSGDGVGIRSESFFGRTSDGGPKTDKITGNNIRPLNTPITTRPVSTRKKYLKIYNKQNVVA